MELGIILYALLHTGATLVVYRSLQTRKQIRARIRRALRTAYKIEVV